MDLEALVGHLFIVGGRSVRAASPGAAAIPPPRRAARGRNADTLFCLISLSEEQRQPASFYEQIVSTVSDTFFNSTGSVTSAMRSAVNASNLFLVDWNSRLDNPVGVGLTCAVLREETVYVTIAGPARAFLISDGTVTRMPDDLDVRSGTVPLGKFDDPDVRFFSQDVKVGDFLILCDSSLNQLTDTTLSFAVESTSVDTTLTNLTNVAGDFAAAEVIKFVAPEGGTVRTQSAATLPQKSSNFPSIFGKRSRASEPEVAEQQPERTLEAQAPVPLPPAAREEIVVAPTAPIQIAASKEETTPQAKVEPETNEEEAQEKTSLAAVAQAATVSLAKFTGRTREIVDRVLPDEERQNPLEEQFRLPLPAQIGVAISVALIATIITTVIYQTNGQNSTYFSLILQAEAEIEQARADSNNQAEARPHWEAAVALLEEADTIRAASDEVSSLQDEALTALDSYDSVTRVTAVPLRNYEAGTFFRGPILRDLSLYVIDTTSDILYREDLNPEGTQLRNQRPQVITRQGELVNEQVIGGLIDLEWIQDGGIQGRDELGLVTRNGLLVTYSPSQVVDAEILPGFGAWQDPRAIAVYNGDLYILDAGANQIWRYVVEGGRYTDTPELYFTDITPDLSTAIDFSIDTNGNMYILQSNGAVSKYFQGRPELLNYTLPQPLARPSAIQLNASVIEQALYVTDPGGGRLYSTTLTGTFLVNFKDDQNAVFGALSGVYAGEGEQIYITAGNALYYFNRP